ncbi:hypothetical protein [Gemmata obscuriglobus]|uniref:Uncharacterized protein n=1 Tax=Gemmata obscuriglobus TaxID=114 RepID=A0A2Z3HEV8_9BACT|nr:hypothetical protein [Gemmata obscuriglobus]AWM39840.1 hypothetical protein C1280_24415 [Gemmata obscuriglobus]
MKFRCSKIKWDTDGKRVRGLPKELVVELDMDQIHDMLDPDELNDQLSSLLSDESGWLVEDYEVEPVPSRVLILRPGCEHNPTDDLLVAFDEGVTALISGPGSPVPPDWADLLPKKKPSLPTVHDKDK